MATSLLLVVVYILVTLSATTPMSYHRTGCRKISRRYNVTNWPGEHCWGLIELATCVGYCQTSEFIPIGHTYPEPERNVNVCSANTYLEDVETILTNCHPGHEPEVFKIARITSCMCNKCDPNIALCL